MQEKSTEASSLTRFRERLGEQGAEELLKQTVEVALEVGLLKKSALKEMIVDSIVQEKNISYPTDGKLINKPREHLVEEANREGVGNPFDGKTLREAIADREVNRSGS